MDILCIPDYKNCIIYFKLELMTEHELKLLGFEKQIITDDTWYIEIVDCEPSIKFETFGEAQALINQLKKHICPKKSSKTT